MPRRPARHPRSRPLWLICQEPAPGRIYPTRTWADEEERPPGGSASGTASRRERDGRDRLPRPSRHPRPEGGPPWDKDHDVGFVLLVVFVVLLVCVCVALLGPLFALWPEVR